MIDDSVLTYEKELNDIFTPIGINATVTERDNCYYLTVDGSRLWSTAEQWEKHINRSFTEFITVFLPKMFGELESTLINETRVEFRIGTIFDMMLRIK